MRQHSEATSKRVGDLEIYAGSDLKTVQLSLDSLHIRRVTVSAFMTTTFGELCALNIYLHMPFNLTELLQ